MRERPTSGKQHKGKGQEGLCGGSKAGGLLQGMVTTSVEDSQQQGIRWSVVDSDSGQERMEEVKRGEMERAEGTVKMKAKQKAVEKAEEIARKRSRGDSGSGKAEDEEAGEGDEEPDAKDDNDACKPLHRARAFSEQCGYCYCYKTGVDCYWVSELIKQASPKACWHCKCKKRGCIPGFAIMGHSSGSIELLVDILAAVHAK
ncbi:hypothetical protein M413DRAFT_9201 [Hebeloma cylindrosporum]|uniref:Uncharacterized protein n=1 Tax=Hebeloma cylindrosporum TaxID=76867 RepID=A0A0C3C848_HEBCY|nr:hypothetical protein M413DRAFT_9201 [Hebeloma cylindrosporum h7]